MSPFDLGRILYEARIREAWNFGDKGERRLKQHPYPRHVADQEGITAESDLAIAQAKALLKVCEVHPKPPADISPTK